MIAEGTSYGSLKFETESTQPDYWSCWAHCKSKKSSPKYFTYMSKDYPDARYAGDCACLHNSTGRISTAQHGLFSGELQCPGKLADDHSNLKYSLEKYQIVEKSSAKEFSFVSL